MTLTREARRRNMAYARYQRAAVVLVLFPTALWQEASQPTPAHALRVVAVVTMGLLAGWMHREATSWWAETPPPGE